MEQTGLQRGNTPFVAGTDFFARPASGSWESIPLADFPQCFVWVWFKPVDVPHGLVVRIPDETFRDYPQPDRPLTMRKILLSAGIDPALVLNWHLQGASYDAVGGTNPLLDAAIPGPSPGADPNIIVLINVTQVNTVPSVPAPAPALAPVAVPPPAPVPGVAPAPAPGVAPAPAPRVAPAADAADSATQAELFEGIETEWAASLDIERQMKRLRKRLVDMAGKLKHLNRDLNPQERIHSDNQDKKDWMEARRWMRECAIRVSRCIKEHDIGDTSAAGQRKWFEQAYEQFVVPRLPVDNLQQMQTNFEFYRKMLTTLQINMHNAYTSAEYNAERRALKILHRIAIKIKEATNRKNIYDVLLDG